MNKLTKIFDWVGGIAMILAVAAMVINILLRIFGLSLTGTYDIVCYTALLFASASIPICVLERAHITVDVLTMRLPAVPYRVLEIIAGIVNIISYVILAYAGYTLAFTKLLSGEASDTLKIPVGPMRLFWAACVTVVIILSIIQLIQTVRSKPQSREERAGGAEE